LNGFEPSYGSTAGAASAAFGGEAGAAGSAAGAAGASDTPLVLAPGMEAQGMAESQLLNAGVVPGSAEWTSALSSAGLDSSVPLATTPYNPPTAPMGTDLSGGAPISSGPAPVVQGSTPIPGAAANSGGIINGARGAVTSIGNWYNSLSPASRLIIGTAISQGASAAFAQHRQSQLIDRANQQADQQRSDQVRRHYVPSFDDNAFKPRGIIDGQRNGG